jgi:hypothetical protein
MPATTVGAVSDRELPGFSQGFKPTPRFAVRDRSNLLVRLWNTLREL